MKGNFYALRRPLSPLTIFIRFLLFLFAFSFAQQVDAKTVVIGTGSGTLNQTSMAGLNPGDVLAITPGTYSGGNFSNLNWITITNNGGTVTFTGTVTLTTLVGVTFSGFNFLNVNGSGIRWNGNFRRCTEKNINFTYVSGVANDASDNNAYNGDTSSMKMYMMTFDSLKLYQTNGLLMGSWGNTNNGVCYMDSMIISHVTIDSTLTNGTEVRGIYFRANFHDWRVTYKGVITVMGDVGLIYINGNGSFHHIYRNGGRGYIMRIWNVGLNGLGTTYFYDNIDLNTATYGTIDTRIDQTVFTNYVTGGNCYVWNNTSGNKADNIGYWSSVAVIGNFPPPYICEVKNNLGFNLQTNNKPKIAMDQSSQTWVADTSNNLYFNTNTGVVDPTTCIPYAGSPVLGKGLTIPLITDDIYHTPRSGAYDVGAVQHTGAIIPPPVNQPPLAVVTPSNQAITLPTNTVSLNGSKSYDPDGIISIYAWTQNSGPAASTLTNAATATATASGLKQGTYIFKLVVTDNNGATATAYDTVTVNPAVNLPPIANAGASQTITLPTNSVTLNGSASKDQDSTGNIVSYSWTQSSGPSAATIANPAGVTTAVNNLVQGVYVFKLTVTDNGGATASDTVSVTVNAAANQPPVANAGASQTITLPLDSVTLNGTASADPDGTIASYNWIQVSGPSTAVITNGNTATPKAGSLQAGVYVFQLTVTDNKGATGNAQVKVTVISAGSLPPVANAGADQTITLPTNTITLNGSASQAPAGSISTYSWTEASGPAGATIASPGNAVTAVNNLVKGVYIFKLTITDNTGATASDSVTVTVNAAPNQPPVANAGASQTITLPVNSTGLDGSASTDPDGTIASYSWTEISGPSTATITNGNTAKPTVSGLQAGQYVFQLTVTDNQGATATAQVKVTVAPAINQPPVANAGPNQTITLPTNSVNLDGTKSYDPDGTIVSYSWAKISGPGAITITNSTTATPTVVGLVAGQYVFELTVTDNSAATAKAQVNITVNAAPVGPNQPPVANAGINQTITLPTNTVALDGTRSFDPDGAIVAYSWAQVSGPSTATIAGATSATSSVSGLIVAGQYVFELTVTDNSGAASKAQVTITVDNATTQPMAPIADAGQDTTIALPASIAILDGSASSAPGGSISSYEWQEISGPNSATFSSFSSAVSTISDLIVGDYMFQLTVTNSNGVSASATVKVSVINTLRASEQIVLYPNPAHDVINLRLISDSTGEVKVNIFDMNGRLVNGTQMQKPQSYMETSLNISRLAGGTYVLQAIIGSNKTMIAKFIKQ